MSETHTGLLDGRYELEEPIGRGGLAVVYRAIDRRLERVVAVKVLGEHVVDDPAAAERLAREARAAASLTSPHVVQVFDFGEADGRPYLVMEYLPGGTLATHVAGRLPLGPALVADYGRQIALGLAAAHRRGLIHRDVTLRNVLVGPDGRLKVADFGIATVAGGARLTRTGVTMGTAISMAPEQARGQAVTPATDVYGLGVVLYELATGRPPFTGESDVAVALQHLQASVVPPRSLNPAIPEWLEAVILRSLAKDPADRYPDGAALVAALAAEGAPPPVPAPLPAEEERPTAPLPAAASTAAMARPTTNGATTKALGRAPAVGRASSGQARTAAQRRHWRWGALLLASLLPVLLVASLMAAGQLGAVPTTATATPAATASAKAPTAMPPDTRPSPASGTRVAQAPVVQPAASPTAGPTPRLPTATPVPSTPTLAPATPTPAPPTPTAVPPTPTVAPTATSPPPQPTVPAAVPAPKPGNGNGNGNKKKDDEKRSERWQVALGDVNFSGGYRNEGESRYPDRTGEQRTAIWIYGGRSDYPAMSARFQVEEAPDGKARLTLIGMDGEDAGKMPIRVTVNDAVIYEGDNPLPDWRWGEVTLEVPKGVLRKGDNTLTIRSLSSEANFNSPHFFMLDAARLEWDE